MQFCAQYTIDTCPKKVGSSPYKVIFEEAISTLRRLAAEPEEIPSIDILDILFDRVNRIRVGLYLTRPYQAFSYM